MLAHVVEKHFREHAVKEVDTLASFMCAVKAKGEQSSLSAVQLFKLLFVVLV